MFNRRVDDWNTTHMFVAWCVAYILGVVMGALGMFMFGS